MIKNITIYLCLLASAFLFNVFYYAWFSWFLLLAVLCLPIISLAISLPFMIISAVNGFIVFSKDRININDDFYIGVAGKKRAVNFCPLLRIKLKAINNFAQTKDKVKISYSGTFKKAVFTKYNKLSENCGYIELEAKYCKVYDLMGIFFIPIKINTRLGVNIIPKPQKPDILPNYENVAVLGYKPKPGGGFSDFYELRKYQSGDSIKNIHWKLSSKYDDLIVREPCNPVYRKLAVKLVLCDDKNKNNDILARFLYACRCIFVDGGDCCVICQKVDSASRITNENEAVLYLESLYRGLPYKKYSPDESKLVIYSVFDGGEEVSAI